MMAPIPEPEAKHIISESDPLIVLEYAEHLNHEQAAVIKEELKRQGVNHCLILGDGARIDMLHPQPGDVVVYKTKVKLSDARVIEAMGALHGTLRRAGNTNQWLFLDGGDNLSTVSEETMRRAGWVRAPKE